MAMGFASSSASSLSPSSVWSLARFERFSVLVGLPTSLSRRPSSLPLWLSVWLPPLNRIMLLCSAHSASLVLHIVTQTFPTVQLKAPFRSGLSLALHLTDTHLVAPVSSVLTKVSIPSSTLTVEPCYSSTSWPRCTTPRTSGRACSAPIYLSILSTCSSVSSNTPTKASTLITPLFKVLTHTIIRLLVIFCPS
jgi:hypothetical protein